MGPHVLANHTERPPDERYFRWCSIHTLRAGPALRVAAGAIAAEPDPAQRSGRDAGLDDRAQPAPHQRPEPLSQRGRVRLSSAFYPRNTRSQHADSPGTGMGADFALQDLHDSGAFAIS